MKLDVEKGDNEVTMVTNEKGALALSTSSSGRVDFFFHTGKCERNFFLVHNNMFIYINIYLFTYRKIYLFFCLNKVRGIEESKLFEFLEAAWRESPLDTLKIVFYIRDCRGGKGERAIFRSCMQWLIRNHKQQVLHNLPLVVEYGRWEDLLWFIDGTEQHDSDVSAAVIKMFAQKLGEDLANMKQGNPISICAKWAPSEKGKHDRKFGAVALICRELGISKQEYRTQYLGPLREYLKIVERLMCLKRWTEIDYNKVPSIAMHRLKKSFAKNDAERFAQWQEKLRSGDPTAKVNASVIDPHTLVKQYLDSRENEEDTVAEEQWKEILLRVSEMGSLNKALVLSDVSGSMYGDPMIVSIALGILISTVTQKPYQNLVLTFETSPQFHHLQGNSLREQVQSLSQAPWGGSTDLGKAFKLILQVAQKNNVPQEDMPDKLFIISDMQFDIIEGYDQRPSLDGIRQMFKNAGYIMPKIGKWLSQLNGTILNCNCQ